MTTRSYLRPNGMSQCAADAEALLYRYPDIDEQEVATLTRAFRDLPLLDFGILAADPRLGAKLDALYADHGDKLRPPLARAFWPAIVMVMLLLLGSIYFVAA